MQCIELYIDGDEDERIGFYSLEMASDLELDPKPHHIIAFEDAGDCKNLCYIIQAHMEMIGNGNAFVVPQLPKVSIVKVKLVVYFIVQNDQNVLVFVCRKRIVKRRQMVLM